MNLGGATPDFMTNDKKMAKYKTRLPAEVMALLAGREVVGLTEINPRWYAWLMGNEAFTQNGRYKAVFDGHDVAIVWHSWKVEPTNPLESQKIIKSFLRSEIPVLQNPACYNWRQFMAVEFKCLASPQVVFTAACTHSIAGSIESGPRITEITGKKAKEKSQ